jgi:DNA-binding transcriptional MocR family regulator
MTIWAPDLTSRSGPRYRAIADALGEDSAKGRLKPGTRLPTHRELAERLGVTVGTVSRAYAEAARRGLVSGEVGRGTFARGPASELGQAPATAPSEPAAIDLSRNHPPPLDAGRGGLLAKTFAALARRDDLGPLLDYAPDGGARAHRAAGASWIALSGLEAAPDDVLVTNGSQHGMTAVFGAITGPGDLVVTEALTYPGMKALASLLHLRLQGLPMDAHGLRPDGLEAACRTGNVRALYTIPTIHNPTTAVMPEARRREIAKIARQHGILIVEDDVHGLLAEDAPLPISAFAPETSCYLTGTAKSLAPGLRIGYVLAPPALVPRLAAGIRATTWMATPLMAEIAAEWIHNGTARQILKRRREEAKARQKIAATALGRFEADAHPSGNHVWLHLPDPWRSETFADQLRRRGVAVTPAQAFLVGRATAPHAVRVCLGAARDRAELEQGLRTLVEVLDGPTESGMMVM